MLSTDSCSLRVVFAYGYEQSLFPFRDSEIEGNEKQASEREIDCGSTVALAFKDVGDFCPRSLVYFCKGIPGLASKPDLRPRHEICLDVPHTLTICSSSCLSSVIFGFCCYVHCLYLGSRHNSKYFVVPV